MPEIRLARLFHHPRHVLTKTRFDTARALGAFVVGGVGALALVGASIDALASDFSLRTETTPLAVTIPVEATTLIRMDANRIRSAIFDRTLMDIQTDKESGTVYVLPKTEGESTVYLTAVSGETAALRLLFKNDAPARTIVLEKEETLKNAHRTDPDPVQNLRPLRAAGFSADIKRVVTLLLRGDTSTGEVMRSERRTAGPAAQKVLAKLLPLKAKLTDVWRADAIEASHFRLKNGTIRPIALDPRALSSGGIYAVALTSQTLMPGDSTDLILVEADRGL